MVNGISRRDFIKLAGFSSVAALWGCRPGAPLVPTFTPEVPPLELEDRRIKAALRRITFGPRPEEVERAKTIGLDAFIEEQLDFSSIEDDALDLRVQGFTTLHLGPGELSRLEKKYTRPAAELIQATLLRAVHSRRQLYEQMVNFWSDHFNIHILKKTARFLKTVDDRDVIRRHALGDFRDLLSASMHSPAMLVYLDNATNAKDGPNENYARELLELHTLGTNAGFMQEDVVDVARVLTGWSVVGLLKENSGEYLFRDADHDEGPKMILGVEFPAGRGVQDGEQLIDLLTNHPAAATFISYKLVRRFVSDVPPPALVTRAASAFRASRGNIQQTLSVILHSEEFYASLGLKLKRPFEYVVSALRQTRAETTLAQGAGPMVMLEKMGHLPFMFPGPNGYPDVGHEWLNSNDLLNRWNFAIGLAGNLFEDTRMDWHELVDGSSSIEAGFDLMCMNLLGGMLPNEVRDTMLRVASSVTDADPLTSAGALLLASPYFQYR
jgi:hypothetical protein